jgi:hypothetical protein
VVSPNYTSRSIYVHPTELTYCIQREFSPLKLHNICYQIIMLDCHLHIQTVPLLPLKLWVWFLPMTKCNQDNIILKNVFQWLAAGLWISRSIYVHPTELTYCIQREFSPLKLHNICYQIIMNEIMLCFCNRKDHPALKTPKWPLIMNLCLLIGFNLQGKYC